MHRYACLAIASLCMCTYIIVGVASASLCMFSDCIAMGNYMNSDSIAASAWEATKRAIRSLKNVHPARMHRSRQNMPPMLFFPTKGCIGLVVEGPYCGFADFLPPMKFLYWGSSLLLPLPKGFGTQDDEEEAEDDEPLPWPLPWSLPWPLSPFLE